jgi:hypothetical protein
MMIRLNTAYMVLRDPDNRAEYDCYLGLPAAGRATDRSHLGDPPQSGRRVIPLGLRGRVLERLADAA